MGRDGSCERRRGSCCDGAQAAAGRSRFHPSHWHLCRWREAAAPPENPLCILERGLSVFTTRAREKQGTVTSRSQAWSAHVQPCLEIIYIKTIVQLCDILKLV